MTDETPDPAATFRADQAAAQETELTRDNMAWETLARHRSAAATETEMDAALALQKAMAWKRVSTALANVLWALALFVVIAALGLFR